MATKEQYAKWFQKMLENPNDIASILPELRDAVEEDVDSVTNLTAETGTMQSTIDALRDTNHKLFLKSSVATTKEDEEPPAPDPNEMLDEAMKGIWNDESK